MTVDVAAPPSLWRHRQFRTFWIGDTVSQFGDRISELALPFIAVTMLGAHAIGVGLLTAAIWTPNLLALFVGAWVDGRPGKRRMMIAADLLRAAALISVPVAYAVGALTMSQLILVGLVTGAGQVLFGMAYQAFYVGLVPKASYVDANSKLSATLGVSYVAGPAIGGGLIQALTAPVSVLFDALSFLFSASAVARVRVDEPPPAPRGPSTARLAVDGLKLILSRPLLRASLACTATVNLFTFIANALLILFASRELGLTPGQIGLSLGVGAVGAVLGAVLAPPVSRLWGIGPAAIVGAALFPLPIAVTALAGGATWQKMALLGGMEFLSGIGVMLLDVNLNALLTRATPDDARGRRAGAYSAVNYGVRPLGALAGGFIGTAIGVRPSLVIAGVGGALCAFWLLASPVRHLHTIDDVDCE